MYPRDSALRSAGFPVDAQGLPRSSWSEFQWHSNGFPSLQNAGVLAWWTQCQPISYQNCPSSPPTASHQQSSQWVFPLFSSNKTLHTQSHRTGLFAFHCYWLCAALYILNHTLPVLLKWCFSFCKLLILQRSDLLWVWFDKIVCRYDRQEVKITVVQS